MARTVRHYFARGNTANGVHFLYDSAFQGLKTIFLLQGMQGTGKSMILAQLAEEMTNQGYHVEGFHSSLNPKELDAIIVCDLKVGIADGRQCAGLSSMNDVEIVNLDLNQAVEVVRLSEGKSVV